MDGMLDLPGHEGVGILLEDAQTGTRAKVNPLTAIDGAGIIRRVFEFTAAGSFVFRWRGEGSLRQLSIILFARMVF